MAKMSWTVQLRSARDISEQTATLRSIKNEIVGHPLRKELAVSQGIIEPVLRLAVRQNTRQDGTEHNHTFAVRPLVEEEVVRLQALHILASIAQGGPSFLPSLNNASVLQAILSNICPANNPSQIVLASLRAISNMAAAAAVQPSIQPANVATIAEALFHRQHLGSLSRILSQSSHAPNVQNSIRIAATLITDLCVEERYQHLLASSGVLDALATRIASFVVAEGLVIPGADILARRDELQDYFPPAAPRTADLSVIFQAVATIITGSKLRASQLLYSPSILAVLPGTRATDYLAGHRNEPSWSSMFGMPSDSRKGHLNALDYLLPCLPFHNHKTSSAQAAAFPPLGTSGGRSSNGRSAHLKQSPSAHNSAWTPSSKADVAVEENKTDAEEEESPLIAYLIFVLRSKDSLGRLAAASVLSVLYRAGLTSKTRESAIATLVIPLLLDLLHNEYDTAYRDASRDEKIIQQTRTVREKTPIVLAMFITDNEYLQRAAFDAHAIPRLCSMLKMAYDPVPENSSVRLWAPTLPPDEESNETQSPHLTNFGLSPLLLHNIKVRESTLRAIAAIVPFKDEYRKVVVDEGLVPYIVESMNSRPGKPAPKTADRNDNSSNGVTDEDTVTAYGVNPLPVIIAACGAIRALSRSVSILRTTLIDIGIAPPVINLLHHSDIEVQIAATATMCNLVTDISPMRETIIEAGVVKILCEHAHSTNARLRLNALWALKHFVNAVSSDLKRQCIEELGQGWLVQLICDNTEDDALAADRSDKGTATEQGDEDVDMGQFEEQVEAAFSGNYGQDSLSRPSSSSLSRPIRDAERRLASLRDVETNPVRKAKTDDIAVQEQGLSLIRNLIGPTGPGASSEVPDMVDYLLTSLGPDRLFHILATKVRSKTINAYPRRTSARTSIQAPAPELILAVCMILVHMAASIPRHRQIVISQTSLLESLVKHFHHPNVEIRLAMCHLVTNLTWLDDQADGKACVARTTELEKLGFLEQLELLEHDTELNVRERAKCAVWQMKQSASMGALIRGP